MKSIELKSAVENVQGQEFTLTTEQLITECLNQPPKVGQGSGFSREDFKKRARIDVALENIREVKITVPAEGVDVEHQDIIPEPEIKTTRFVDLEDADFETLKLCVDEMLWSIRSKFIQDFIELKYTESK